MVSRTAVALVAFAALAASVYAQTDGSTTNQYLNKLVPLPLNVTSNTTAYYISTPHSLSESERFYHAGQVISVITDPIVIIPGVIPSGLAFGNKPPLSFLGKAIETTGTEVADVTYVFGAESKPFLEKATKPGGMYTFVKAFIYTPQEANPVAVESGTGFLNADGSPFEAHISTTAPTVFVPNVAVRFDYSLPGTSPTLVSLYYTDRRITSTAAANLVQSYGVTIFTNGTITVG